MTPTARWLLLAAGLVLAAGCAETPLALDTNPQGRFVVLVFDHSLSMLTSDPEGYSREGTQLAVALLPEGDNLGVVGFSLGAEVISPLQAIRGPADRRRIQHEVSEPQLLTNTNFVAALRLTREMLEAAGSPPSADIVFLTDGDPTIGGGLPEVAEEAQQFHAAGWRIHTVALSDEARYETLNLLSGATGGGTHRIYDPKDLPYTLLRVIGGIEDLVFRTDLEPVAVPEGTVRLIYVLVKRSEEAGFTGLAVDGSAVDLQDPSIYVYPDPGETDTKFQALNVPAPTPGVWSATVREPVEVGFVLGRLPFHVEVPDEVRNLVVEDGGSLPLAFRVVCEDSRTLDRLEPSLAGRAHVPTAVGQGETGIITVSLVETGLASRRESPTAVRFDGRAACRLVDPEVPEQRVATLELSYRDAVGKVWTLERPVPFTVVPAALTVRNRTASATDGEFEVGIHGDRPATLVVTPDPLVHERGEGVVRPGYDIRVEPAGPLPVQPGQSVRITYRVQVAPDHVAGRYRGDIRLHLADDQGEERELSIPVECEVVR